MTDAQSYTMALDLTVQNPVRVLNEAARELVRRRLAASDHEALALLAGDVPKALAVLIELHDLTSAGAVVLYHRAWIARPGVFEAGMKYWKPGMASPAKAAIWSSPWRRCETAMTPARPFPTSLRGSRRPRRPPCRR